MLAPLLRVLLILLWLKANLSLLGLRWADELADRFEDCVNLAIVGGYVALKLGQFFSDCAI